jgi:hypothetical protein
MLRHRIGAQESHARPDRRQPRRFGMLLPKFAGGDRCK